MESDSFLLFSLFTLFFILSNLFSGTETALLTLSQLDRKELERSGSRRARRLLGSLSHAGPLFVSLRAGIYLINAVIILIAALIAEQLAGQFSVPSMWMTVLVIGTAVLALFLGSTLWSNVIVIRYNRRFAELVSLPLMLYAKLTLPVGNLIRKLIIKVALKTGVLHKGSVLAKQKLIALIENGEVVDRLEDTERQMIDSIFEFGETEVREIMVPRIDMVCVEENTSLEELLKLIKEKGHSRIPLYKEEVDNISGILYAKDLLPYLVNSKSETLNLRSLARPASFVPESKKLGQLLREFQQKKYHIAIVVDEYGGTAGLVTFEDVIEEIVGDIQDEYDQEPPLYRKIDDNTYMVNAKIDLHELNEQLDFDLPTEGEYESLGGFIFSLTGYVPEKDEVVKYENYTFIVDRVERNRIMQVRVVRETTPESEEINE